MSRSYDDSQYSDSGADSESDTDSDGSDGTSTDGQMNDESGPQLGSSQATRGRTTHGTGPDYTMESELENPRGDIAEGKQNTAASRAGPDDDSDETHTPQERLDDSVQTSADATTLREKNLEEIRKGASRVKEPSWNEEAERVLEAPETDLELLRMVDAFLDEIDEDLQTARERERAGEHYQVSDIFGNETTTQSKLNFDYVKNNGIIVDGDTYYGLQQVDPTKWQSKDAADKKNTMGAYVAFLKALQWGISIPCYPKAFDFTRYLEQIYEAGTKAVAEGAHPVLDIGRRIHISWADRRIDPDKIKRREFYVVCSVEKSEMKKSMAGRGDQSLVGYAYQTVSDYFADEEDDDVEQACIAEIRQRQQTMSNELAKTGVQVDKVATRQEAMELLYYYYNHVEPVLDKFDHGTMSKADFSPEAMP